MSAVVSEGLVSVIRLEGGKANAMTPDLLDSINELMEVFENNESRAGVLTGYERFFSAGLSLPMLYDLERDDMRRFMLHFTAVMLRVFMSPKPIVAAINGHAIAGGCVLALQCDYRIMAEGEYKIGLNEAQIGLGLPAVVMETLKVQVPSCSLIPIAIQGKLFGPEEALDVQLIDDVAPPNQLMDEALSMASELAQNPTLGVAHIKQGIRLPVVERIQHICGRDLEAWLDTWYSPEAREKIAQTVQRLKV